MMLKKIISVLAAVSCVLTLASCGKSVPETETQTTSVPVSETTENTGSFAPETNVDKVDVSDIISEQEMLGIDVWETLPQEDGTVYVTYRGNKKIVIVPETIGDKKVTGIFGFSGSEDVEEVFIPDTVTVICYSAFDSCHNLKKVHIPDSVTTIEYNAFICSGIESIVLPANLVSLGFGVFGSCEQLKEVKFKCTGLKEIPDNCFSNCTAIKDITIPNGVTTIGKAFPGIDNLTVHIPETVTSMTDSFENGKGITIYGRPDTCVSQYAKEHGNTFVPAS